MLAPCPTISVLLGTDAERRSASLHGFSLISATGGDSTGFGGATGLVVQATAPINTAYQAPPRPKTQVCQHSPCTLRRRSMHPNYGRCAFLQVEFFCQFPRRPPTAPTPSVRDATVNFRPLARGWLVKRAG